MCSVPNAHHEGSLPWWQHHIKRRRLQRGSRPHPSLAKRVLPPTPQLLRRTRHIPRRVPREAQNRITRPTRLWEHAVPHTVAARMHLITRRNPETNLVGTTPIAEIPHISRTLTHIQFRVQRITICLIETDAVRRLVRRSSNRIRAHRTSDNRVRIGTVTTSRARQTPSRGAHIAVLAQRARAIGIRRTALTRDAPKSKRGVASGLNTHRTPASDTARDDCVLGLVRVDPDRTRAQLGQ